MRIPVLVEPDYRNSLWARQTLEGIAREAARKKYEPVLLDAAHVFRFYRFGERLDALDSASRGHLEHSVMLGEAALDYEATAQMGSPGLRSRRAPTIVIDAASVSSGPRVMSHST